MEKNSKQDNMVLAEVDYLTGLANRRGLYRYFEELEEGWVVHAMFIDVDNFKRVNDSYGHSMGDELLKQIAKLIREGSDGFVSRIGGDEFVVVIDGNYSQEAIENQAKALLRAMEDLDFRRDILSFVSLSVGVVMNQSSDISADDILAKCDDAMYRAKFNGKNCYAFYHSNDKEIEIRRSIEGEMEEALLNGEFVPYFQPKVNTITSALSGAEVLVRWNHPKEGIRLPAQFIPLFEKNGFIAKLDMAIYEAACKEKRQWKGKSYEHIPVSVNMSRLHLYNRHFPEQLEEIAQKYEIPLGELEIEITESVFIKDPEVLIQMVDLLQKKGFLVSIDDFGSGFSALNLLKDIPVNTIKLDRGFMQLSSNDIRGKKVIRNVIAMCKDLKLDVVAEGIEDKTQLDFVTSCGCQIAQGYYYSPPLCKEDFILFAEEYSKNPLEYFRFSLNGNLMAEDGSMKASFSGSGFEYVQGIYRDSKAVRFPGGEPEHNTVHVPTRTMPNDSYTISLWIRPRVNQAWASALYVKFESGFLSVVPWAFDGNSAFRVRDSREVDGWHDVTGCQLREGEWVHYTITYNAKTEVAIAFINGEVVGRRENVPANQYVKWIMLGGDVFQPSFQGDICELVIYNETKDFDFVRQLHESYISREDFIAFPQEVIERD